MNVLHKPNGENANKPIASDSIRAERVNRTAGPIFEVLWTSTHRGRFATPLRSAPRQ